MAFFDHDNNVPLLSVRELLPESCPIGSHMRDSYWQIGNIVDSIQDDQILTSMMKGDVSFCNRMIYNILAVN